MTMRRNGAKYFAYLIAKYFIWRAQQARGRISNKKLQKLLYYAQAWHLVFYDKPLFRESIEAWVHGPAVREVYAKYRKYGFQPIEEQIEDSTISGISDNQDTDLLDEVWRVYGKCDADYLERLTHSELPWREAREDVSPDEFSSNIIKLETMRDYYRELNEKKGKKDK